MLVVKPDPFFTVELRCYHHGFDRMHLYAILNYPDPRNEKWARMWWEAFGPRTPHYSDEDETQALKVLAMPSTFYG